MLQSALFFFNVTATTDIYTLSLHDALPILPDHDDLAAGGAHLRDLDVHLGDERTGRIEHPEAPRLRDRKSTRLNSSHLGISYAVFCLKKKKKKKQRSKNKNNTSK